VAIEVEKLYKEGRREPFLHDIREACRQAWGLVPSNATCYRAKEHVVVRYWGTREQSWVTVPAYLDRLRKENPGSYTKAEYVTLGGNRHLHRVFFMLEASKVGKIVPPTPLVGPLESICLGDFGGIIAKEEVTDLPSPLP